MIFLRRFRHIGAELSLILVLSSLSSALLAQTNITAEQSAKIVERYAGVPFKGFDDFTFALYRTGGTFFDREQKAALGAFVLNEELTNAQRKLMFRALGLYTQLKYGGDALRSLGDLVAIPTVRNPELLQHKNPAFVQLGKLLKRMSKQYGLRFRNVGGRVFEISFPRKNRKLKRKGALIALHAHADVVPADPQNWVLADGTQLDPFALTRVGDKFYGRGAQDDKNGIVAVMYAMRVIVEERLTLFNNIKLLIDTTEETTGDAIPYYFERNPTPDYNFALDGDYPVVIAEKGFGVVKASFPVRKAGVGDLEFIKVTGGLAYNQIPSVSRATVAVEGEVSRWVAELNRLGASFVQDNGANFSIKAAPLLSDEISGLSLELHGVSAHSSDPASGVNPVSRMLVFIDSLTNTLPVRDNHITDAAQYAAKNWGLDFYGNKIGVNFSHDFMGPLTAAFTKIAIDEESFEVAVNLRIPVGKPILQIESDIKQALEQWQRESGVAFSLALRTKEPMYRDPQGRWVNLLLDVASENLGMPREFGSSAGGTSIHDLPNGVQFGLAMPNEKYTGHNANEFKTLDQFLLDLQVVTEMIARIGQTKNLQ